MKCLPIGVQYLFPVYSYERHTNKNCPYLHATLLYIIYLLLMLQFHLVPYTFPFFYTNTFPYTLLLACKCLF